MRRIERLGSRIIGSKYFRLVFYLLCNPDISHLITYSTLSGNWDSTSFFRRRSKKGLKTLCKRRIIKIVSSSFNSTFSPWNNINQIRLSLLFLKFFFWNKTRVKVNLLQDRQILKYYQDSKILAGLLQEICQQAKIYFLNHLFVSNVWFIKIRTIHNMSL